MRYTWSACFIAWVCLLSGCSVVRSSRDKFGTRDGRPQAVSLSLPGEQISMSSGVIPSIAKKDTIKVQFEGHDVIIMKAVKDDETGEMIANESLDAAVITARFSNVAERKGNVDIQFDITVPQSLRDGSWQLRFRPFMCILGEKVALDSVIVTGSKYRLIQMRGIDQYQRFIDSFVSDSSRLVDSRQLEIFIRRNIPQLYALKSDSAYVSDEQFRSIYGVDEKMAVEHYTNKALINRNNRIMERRGVVYRRYVKSPLITEGIRLDTVMRSDNGDYVYSYTQNITTRPKLRKVDIVVDGSIYDQDIKLYDIPESDTLTFYISSVSTLVDDSEKYLNRVIERRAEANNSYDITFGVSSSELDLTLGNNALEMNRICQNIHDLLCNEAFDLDSIVVSASASPDGSYRHNESLTMRRSEAISSVLDKYILSQQDSIENSIGILMDLDGNVMKVERMHIPFISHSLPEDWPMLDSFIEKDDTLTQEQKDEYRQLRTISDPDRRESAMEQREWFGYMRDRYYPLLRTVRFQFALHRKGMVKDTMVTTEPDTIYAAGIQAIRDRDYEHAAVLLAPYQDYNTAVAYVLLDRNMSALQILENQERDPNINYLLAMVYSRLGDIQSAVECYMSACAKDSRFISRGNLDPEISALIKEYGLNKTDDDDFEY